MATIQASQFFTTSVSEGSSSLQVSQSGLSVVFNMPSKLEETSSTDIQAILDLSTPFEAASLDALIVFKGRTIDPSINVWTFTLDNHDFVVYKAGQEATLVYDTYSGEWFHWASGEGDIWRAYTGRNWLAGYAFADTFGSNIVVGDDTTGSLYFLDPEKDFDDDALLGEEVQRPFKRIVQGQVATKGYRSFPCYAVELLGSIGQVTSTEFTGVFLQVSDDRGHSYWNCGTVNVPIGEYAARVDWRSLGSIAAPGRLFRITDYGALRRIDSLDMLDQTGDIM